MFDLGNKTKKTFLITSLTFFLIANFFAYSLFKPAPVYAQADAAITSAFGAKFTWEKIEDSLLSAALGSLVNGASYFMRKFAYDSAKYIAAGGKGQGALAFKGGFGNYMENTALDSVAGAIDQFGAPFGLSLCKPPDLRIQVNIQVSLSQIYDSESSGGKSGPQPRCKWSDLKQNWSAENLESMYGSKDALSERFSSSLSVTEGDFGVALGLMGKLDRIQAKAEASARDERNEGDGFKSVTNYISGDIKTPANVIKEETKAVTGGKQMDMSATQIAGIYGAGAWQILPMAASVFANTLVSTLLNDIMTNGLFPDDSSGSSSVVDFYAGSLNYNKRAAESAFSYLIAGIPQHDITSYDVVTKYSSCPDNPGLDNCIMDSGLVQAIQRSRVGDPLTIDEAIKIEGGLLHASWKLIPPSRDADNTNIQCYKNNYCYSNIQKLRKARILPLGFEIAALRSDPEKPWTLGQVVEGFDDRNSPFYHLIDPNWILKAPEAQCELKVFGSQLLSENTSLRREECSDFSTCLATGGDGCQEYGYCTKEKNTWNMPGESCPDYYNTCKTYTGRDNSIASYLSRTIDQSSCNIESVGCRAYSTEKLNDEWVRSSEIDLSLKASGREQVLYFNDQINSKICPPEEEGCAMFLHASTTKPIFLKESPEYLGCYDTDPITQDVIDWPQTRADLVLLENTPEQCDNFAGVCIPEEVACEEYTPVNGNKVITGIVGDNFCPNECIGYETFKQEATPFESEKFPLYFVPSYGDVCAPQYEGCDEFTNISAGEIGEGGEQLEYYSDIKYCERPEEDNAKTYYTWQGSESEGYVLKRHSLLQIDVPEATYIAGTLGTGPENIFPLGSPAYSTDDPTKLTQKYNDCNQVAYNIMLDNPYIDGAALTGCYALYDSSGSVYYRMLEDTVSVSDKCLPLRKTDSEMYVDNFLNEANCSEKGGMWDDNYCQRCTGGGFYQVDDISGAGSCMYWSIREEAKACNAASNGCRRYIGNTGGNVYTVHGTSFEPNENSTSSLMLAKQGWSGAGLSVEPEATQVGFYSLKVNQDASYELNAGMVREGAWYELTFWARGNPHLIDISLDQESIPLAVFTLDPLTNQKIYAPISEDWQEYTLGPVQFGGFSDVTTTLHFESTFGSGVYFIDNVTLKRIGGDVQDYEFLIKDSWKTREGYDTLELCDSTPLDGFPGEHLGCREYTTRANTNVQFSGFEKLCRTEAVGCTPLYDTQNYTDEEGGEKNIFNAKCYRGTTTNPGGDGICQVTIDDNEYKCSVPDGDNYCFIEGPISVPSDTYEVRDFATNFVITSKSTLATTVFSSIDNVFVTESTVVIEEDSDIIYLTHTIDSICNGSDYLGCKRVALEERVLPDESEGAYLFSERFITDNPLDYEKTLCVEEQVGCNQYTSGNDVSFFKDPKLSGAGLCNYEEKININGVSSKGWFMDGVGACEDSTSGVPDGTLCQNAEGCASGYTCEDIGILPCYENYILADDEYGLWSNAADNYEGYVGTCGTQYNGCTELIDPADTSGKAEGEPYYVIYDDRLFAQTNECDGMVSQKDGCVLFDKTENPNKYFDSVLTYADSEDKKYALVPPNTTGELNTNELIKVRRDRECSEWLACRSSARVFDTKGNPQYLCQEYRACDEMDEGGNCTHWVRTEYDMDRMTLNKYTSRDTGWSSPDYSGYSLYNKFNPSNFIYIVFDSEQVDDPSVNTRDAYIAYEMSRKLFVSTSTLVAGETSLESFGCFEVSGGVPVKEEGAKCGFDDGGRCYRQRCLYPIDGAFDDAPYTVGQKPDEKERISENIKKMLSKLEHGTCKSYPEQDSPFSVRTALSDIGADDDKSRDPSDPDGIVRYKYSSIIDQFQNANVCQKTNLGTDCSCEYIKVEYGDGTSKDYWPIAGQNAFAKGICINAGQYNDIPCETNEECRDEAENDLGISSGTGECSRASQQGTFYGLKGLCLEYDQSRILTPSKDANKKSEKYPCLTWLPIQVSASAVDLYNADQEAGYYPTDGYDSEGDGRVYCTEATSLGLGYYDGAAASFSGGLTSVDAVTSTVVRTRISAVTHQDCNGQGSGSGQGSNCQTIVDYPSGDILYNYIFTSTANYDPPGSSVDVGSINFIICPDDPGALVSSVGEYGNLVCTVNDKEIWYKTMQSWAWRNISTYSRVMRIDVESGRSAQYCRGAGECSGNALDFDLDKNGKTHAVAEMYGFAPQFDAKYTGDTGTIMHPPRLFGMYDYVGDIFEPSQYNYTMLPGNDTNDVYIAESSYLSPEYGNTHASFYVDSSLEQTINEQDIRAMYFVPIAFPDGAEGPNPSIFTKNFKIDFENLRNSEANAAFVSVPTSGKDNFVRYIESIDDDVAYYYVLNNSQIPSYKEYDVSINPRGPLWDSYQANESTTLVNDNIINKRYVSLFYDSDEDEDPDHDFPNFDQLNLWSQAGQGSPEPLVGNQDPFSGECQTADDNNWMAIGMDFNAKGDFLGYITRWCNGEKFDDNIGEDKWFKNGIRFAVITELKDKCIEYSSVYDDSIADKAAGDVNKAWTNRVWQGASQSYGPGGISKLNIAVGFTPFGSLPSLDIRDLSTTSTVGYYTFGSITDGLPYQCAINSYPSNDTNHMFDNSDNTFRCDGITKELFEPEVETIDHRGLLNEISKEALYDGAGRGILDDLFIKFYRVEDVLNDVFDLDEFDYSGTTSKMGNTKPPKIFSLNPFTCTSADKECTAAVEDNITINYRNYIVGEESDYDGNGVSDEEDGNFNDSPDPIIADGNMYATAQFFGYADDNRMPIRRVMVDWGDGTEVANDGVTGMYKNRKPYCDDANGVKDDDVGRCTSNSDGWWWDSPLITCKQDDECKTLFGDTYKCETISKSLFGDAPRACKETYFEFTHEYFCDFSDMTANSDQKFVVSLGEIENNQDGAGNQIFESPDYATEVYDRLKDRDLQHIQGDGDKAVCIYKPRVQLLDNWGWCNGSDLVNNAFVHREEGYYNDTSSSMECNSTLPSYRDKHWTYYKGAVVVIPSD